MVDRQRSGGRPRSHRVRQVRGCRAQGVQGWVWWTAAQPPCSPGEGVQREGVQGVGVEDGRAATVFAR